MYVGVPLCVVETQNGVMVADNLVMKYILLVDWKVLKSPSSLEGCHPHLTSHTWTKM